ncbi:class F sortase [Streptomyces sp. NPDC101213]|uniref:class F sortase n=1 Tax=Streptomyces sp. NPDC101213 TaxID=3366130 RepID=UPI0038231B42
MAVPSSASSSDGSAPARRPRRGLTLLCAGGLLLLAVRLLGDDTPQAGAPSPPSDPRSAPQAAAPASPGTGPAGKHLPRSSPVRLLIPKISVDAPFTDLAIGANGQLQAPPPHDTNLVGWYAKGASPGETGTSIIAGHVDTATSAAVFAELDELRKGDVFRVRRADGRTPVFVVDSVEKFDKDRFPSRRVYGDTADAQVRLITCAGDYDRTVKDYTENLVVFAHLR